MNAGVSVTMGPGDRGGIDFCPIGRLPKLAMDKSVMAIKNVGAICGVLALCLVAYSHAGGQESEGSSTTNKDVDSIAPPGGSLDVIQLENGSTVPALRLDGSVAKRASTGAVIYGRGVYVTDDGVVRRNGKIVRRLAPGESLSISDLEGWSREKPVSSTPPARDVSSTSPVASPSIPGSRSEYPTSTPFSGVGSSPSQVGSASGVSVPIKPGQMTSPASATPAKSRAGEDVFVLGNGTQVPSDLGNGVVGTPNNSGGVDYSDGRSANVDPATGDTVFTNTDGSEASRYTPATEGMGTTPDGKPTETFVMPNGNHVPREQGGGTGVPNDRGGVSYPDGSYTEYDSDTGETVFFDNQGAEIDRSGSQQAYPSTTDNGGSVYVMTNGQTVPRAGPEGQLGTPNASGGVDYEGGVSVNPGDDGRTIVTGSPNGNYISVTNSTDEGGNPTFDLGNGTSVPRSGPGGQGQIVAGGAGVEYQDGTFVTVDAKTGETIVQHPDGSSEIMRGENNRKDAENYVYRTSGESSDNDSGRKKDPNSSSSSSSGTKDNESDDDKGSKDQDNNDDGGDDSSDEGGDDSGGDDEGKDADDTEGADKNLVGDGDGNNDPEGKTTVDDALARKTGDKKEPDSIGPPVCDEGGGTGGPPGGVAEPGAGQQNCVPGGLQPGGEDEDEPEPAPVLISPFGNDFKRDDLRPDDLVGQPGIEGDGISNDGRTLEDKLEDIEGVINPGGN